MFAVACALHARGNKRCKQGGDPIQWLSGNLRGVAFGKVPRMVV